MLCPKGVKRYLQGSHPDRLTTALRRDRASESGFSPMPYADAIARVASENAAPRRSRSSGAPGGIGTKTGRAPHRIASGP